MIEIEGCHNEVSHYILNKDQRPEMGHLVILGSPGKSNSWCIFSLPSEERV